MSRVPRPEAPDAITSATPLLAIESMADDSDDLIDMFRNVVALLYVIG